MQVAQDRLRFLVALWAKGERLNTSKSFQLGGGGGAERRWGVLAENKDNLHKPADGT